MQEAGRESLDEAGTFFVTIAQGFCLVDTGTLQGSIRKEWRGTTLRVSAGGTPFINPKTGKPCNYAVHVEHKNPFMRPAWETVRRFLTAKINENILQKVQE